ncbi:RNA polymerase sigma factor [Dendrosporobacter sp. 1207_IL3150]|uniref:RNA polymerase sigma factor n=1 Tax=Dendrosporobacter sp. 1207_IL3150 TaxID=3084054 RepID=UPI002FD97E8B
MDLNTLVYQAQAGDDEAFEQVCQLFEGLVKKYAYQSHLRPLYEEAVAEAWLALVQAVSTYDAQHGTNFAGYAESKVKFAMWNLFKRERRRWQNELPLQVSDEDESNSLLDILADASNIESEVEMKLLASMAVNEIAELPKRQQQAIFLTVVLGKGVSEAATYMESSPQAVYNLRQRGLARLKILCAGMY